MANQAIALQARAPQMPNIGSAMQQNAQMINMMAQQKAAERQAAQAQQAMQFAQAEETRKARIAGPQFDKASAEAQSAMLKTAMDFNNFIYTGLSHAADPQQAIAIAQRIAEQPQFKDPLFQGAVADVMKTMPQDPNQFGEWRQQTLFKTMDAKDQLEQHFNDVTTGRESWTTAAPKYAGSPMGGAAREVPGSRIQAAEDITYIKGPNGEIIPMPKTVPGTGGPVGGGGGGAVAAALQTNPGAIKDGAFARSQPGYAGASGGFATFNTPEAGIAAQENLLRSAYIGKGFNTIDKIVNRYAPQGPENSSASVSNYKKYIAQRTGIDTNAPISAGQVPAVAAAMREFETGNRPSGKASGGVTLGQPIPTAPTKEQRTQQRGRENVSNTVNTLRDLYAELRERGGAVESGGGLMAAPGNIANYIAGTAVGKPFGRALGTKEQATRDKIINVRRMLVTQIADAAGLSAQEMNSNVELQGLLDAATDPTQSIETVEETLNEIERLYGRPGAKGQRISARRSKPAAPKPAPKPAPRRTAGGANVSDW